MRRHSTLSLVSSIAISFLGSALLLADKGPTDEIIQAKTHSARLLKAAVPQACCVMTIQCGQTVNSILNANDCTLDDGSFIEFWDFQGSNGQEVTIDMRSNQFDTFLLLTDPLQETATVDDDGGEGTNSRIVYELDQTGVWSIGANALFTGDRGTFSLTLTCDVTGPPPPNAPSHLSVTDVSPMTVDLEWQDNSDDETEFRIQGRAPGGDFEDIRIVPANSTEERIAGLIGIETYDFRVVARGEGGDSSPSNLATSFRGPCVASDTVLCLNGERFQVEATWKDFGGNEGSGMDAGPGSDDSGILWFFRDDNWEMLLKVLDGCGVNGHYWVFAAATTNVEYTLKVTDTTTGLIAEYSNPLGTAAPSLTDTGAFETCP